MSTDNEVSVSRFRYMSQLASVFQFPQGKEEGSTNSEVSPANFRVAFQAEFKRLKMRIFFDELLDLSGQKTIKALLSSIGVCTEDDSRISAWYARARGEHILSQAHATLLRQMVPGTKFELHHPVWLWLANPDVDLRTIRRYRARMPDHWHDIWTAIGSLSNHELDVVPQLVDRLSLHKLSYLDSVFLFWTERRCRGTAFDYQRRVNLNRILWLLPILYVDDPIWTGRHRERFYRTISLIDHALGFNGADDPGLHWGWEDRVSMLFHQQWHLQERMKKYPQGLRTSLILRRYMAKPWRWR